MSSRAFKRALANGSPVLFVNIGWAVRYDGTETIVGNHKYLRQHPGAKVGESAAFIAPHNGLCQCGIGYGHALSDPTHIVFVARDPDDQILKFVAVYASARAFRQSCPRP
jgi:hypothetical protein